MNAYIVFFYWEGDNNPVYDSIWEVEGLARDRVIEIGELEASIGSVDYEPVKFNEAGYCDEELEE